MFEPPRCVHPDCEAYRRPEGRFFRRKGFYVPKCRGVRVPRFVCKLCGRGFSRQTFRQDYRDHKPDVNRQALSLHVSGVGIRQIARELGLAKRSLELKLRKIDQHMRRLHRNLMGTFRAGVEFAFDELETFEACRSTRPVTMPVLIEQDSTFIVGAVSAPIPPSGRMTPARRARIAAEEARSGKRRNGSRSACAKVLAAAARHCGPEGRVRVRSDQKKSYPKLVADAFGEGRVSHVRISSRRKRDTSNPLHRINLTLARLRDLTSRLRRRSWLVSKKRSCLDLHVMSVICYRNYHRPRFNDEAETPAQRLGFVPRALTKGHMLSWRQDWGRERSIHPLSPWLESVAEFAERMAGMETETE